VALTGEPAICRVDVFARHEHVRAEAEHGPPRLRVRRRGESAEAAETRLDER
jgi:hypothetical protein